tara:strand:- start:336 stop:1229 length:894 start_codon:yes stop_codon:yes gene_type:complete
MSTTIGFIGQGWIGKNYADDFENRGYETVRYALEEPYNKNREKLSKCAIVLIAVPTPSTPDGFSYEPVRDALSNLKVGTTAVIKSTMLPGTTANLQAEFPDLFVMHSPEFLREVSAAYDAANPDRNIIGIPIQNDEYHKRAEEVLAVLPSAPYSSVMPSYEAELVKYASNCFLYTKVVFMNSLYDLVKANEGNWEILREALINDPRIGDSHTRPIHNSGHVSQDKQQETRGAGGHCFIKDFEAFRRFYQEVIGDDEAHNMLTAMINYNNQLLVGSDKDIDILEGVYGAEHVKKLQNR